MFSQEKALNKFRKQNLGEQFYQLEERNNKGLEHHINKSRHNRENAKATSFLENGETIKRISKTLQVQDYDSTFVIDSILITNEDGVKEMRIYTYDSNGNTISDYWKYRDGTQWVSYYLITYLYDANGNKTSKLWEYWNAGELVKDFRYSYSIDSGNETALVLGEFWDGSQWGNDVRYTSTFDSNGNLTLYLKELWILSNVWENSLLDTHTYDSNGNMILGLYEYWDGTQWVKDWRFPFTYDSTGNLTIEFWEFWDGSQWLNDERYTNTYDSTGNLTYFLDEFWDGSEWENGFQKTYNFDSNGNMTLGFYEGWNGSQWLNYYKDTYTYDSNGNMILGLYEYWDGSQWISSNNYFEFEDSFSRFYSFLGAQIDLFYSPFTITDVEEIELNVSEYSLFQNYPNPFNPSTTINYMIPAQSHVTLNVFDVLGKEVATLVNEAQPQGNYQIKFDASSVNGRITSGIYFYTINAGDFVETRKMILLR